MKKLILILISLGLLDAFALSAEEDTKDTISISGSFGYVHEYVVRGSLRAKGSFQSKLQLLFPAMDGVGVYVRFFSNSPLKNQAFRFGADAVNDLPDDNIDDDTGTFTGILPSDYKLQTYYPKLPSLVGSTDLKDYDNGKLTVEFRNQWSSTVGFFYRLSEQLMLDMGFTYYRYGESGNKEGEAVKAAAPYGSEINQHTEVYVGFATSSILEPQLYFYYDLKLRQIVGEFSVAYLLRASDQLVTQFSAQLGHVRADNYDDKDNSTHYNYYGGSLEVAYSISENLALNLGLDYVANNANDSNALSTRAVLNTESQHNNGVLDGFSNTNSVARAIGKSSADPVNKSIHPGVVNHAHSLSWKMSLGFSY